jgi:hypothetical protein
MNDLLFKLADAMENGGEEKPKEKKPGEEKKKEGKKPEKKNGENPFAKKEEAVPGNGEESAAHEAAETPQEETAEEVAEAKGIPEADENGGEGAPAVAPEAAPAQAVPADVPTIVDFLQSNPNPTDEQFHQFAEQNGFDVHQMEQTAYGLASKLVNLLRGGKMNDVGVDMAAVDPNQLQMGIEVEYEHTADQSIAKKIALDHLVKIPDYYSRLKKMDDNALAEASAAAVPDQSKSVVSEEGSTQEGMNDANTYAPGE